MKVKNIHHISAITYHAQETIDFYMSVLGLNLVKQTLNYDDGSSYHLFFGNEKADLGTLLTFFSWHDLDKKGIKGDGQANGIILGIPKGSMKFWENRLNKFEVKNYIIEKFNKLYLAFEDPHGIYYELVEVDNLIDNNFEYNGVTKQNAILGIKGVIINSHDVVRTKIFLEENLGLIKIDENFMYEKYLIKSEINQYIYLNKKSDKLGKFGIGTIHHIAFGVKQNLKDWKNYLNQYQLYSSPIRDRKYFEAIYFKEPGGTIIELSTLKPGMLIDEDINNLGRKLLIPKHFTDEKVLNFYPVFIRPVDKLKRYGYIDRKSYDAHIRHKEVLNRINELAKKARKEGLTDEEIKERKLLREEYLLSIRSGFQNLVEGVKVVDEKGKESKFIKKSDNNE